MCGESGKVRLGIQCNDDVVKHLPRAVVPFLGHLARRSLSEQCFIKDTIPKSGGRSGELLSWFWLVLAHGRNKVN